MGLRRPRSVFACHLPSCGNVGREPSGEARQRPAAAHGGARGVRKDVPLTRRSSPFACSKWQQQCHCSSRICHSFQTNLAGERSRVNDCSRRAQNRGTGGRRREAGKRYNSRAHLSSLGPYAGWRRRFRPSHGCSMHRKPPPARARTRARRTCAEFRPLPAGSRRSPPRPAGRPARRPAGVTAARPAHARTQATRHTTLCQRYERRIPLRRPFSWIHAGSKWLPS